LPDFSDENAKTLPASPIFSLLFGFNEDVRRLSVNLDEIAIAHLHPQPD
jgi:hypothetical protein